MVDRLLLDEWQYRAIGDIASADWLDIAVVVCSQPPENVEKEAQHSQKPEPQRLSRIYDFYEQIGRRVCARRIRLAETGSRNLSKQLRDVPLLHVAPQPFGETCESLAEADVEAVRSLDLDVLVRFGSRILKGDVLSAPRHGVWSYHHGDPACYRGSPSCFWELSRGEATIGSVLQRLNEEPETDEVLYRSVSSCPKTFWVHLVRSPHYLKSSTFLRRCLQRLYETGEPPRATGEAAGGGAGPLHHKPDDLSAAILLTRLAARSATATVANLARQPTWSITIRRAQSPLKTPVDSEGTVGRLGGRDWQAADPCLFAHDGRVYCFFERLAQTPGSVGEIWCAEIIEGARLSQPERALACAHHVSYPSLFEWRGDIFLTAETGAVGGVRTWQADRFPLAWRYHSSSLENVRAYDPTLLEWNGRWYLFVTVDEAGGGPNDELFLYYSETPLGPWSPHPENPVVSDCRVARPAGALFVEEGKLFRPAQDCSGRYGRAINLCEVTELSTTAYRQRVVGRIDTPVRHATGCHTLSQHGDLQALDIRTTALRWLR